MHRTLFLVCLFTVMILNGADKLKINKSDASSQMYELADISNLTFSSPGTAKLMIRKPDGSEQLFNISEIANLSFSGTAIEKEEFFKKLSINLIGNYPNPFNPTTTINFTTVNNGDAKVEIFNQSGQLISTLHDSNLPPGKHTMQWNAQNYSTGTYFIRISQNGEMVSNKMLLIK